MARVKVEVSQGGNYKKFDKFIPKENVYSDGAILFEPYHVRKATFDKKEGKDVVLGDDGNPVKEEMTFVTCGVTIFSGARDLKRCEPLRAGIMEVSNPKLAAALSQIVGNEDAFIITKSTTKNGYEALNFINVGDDVWGEYSQPYLDKREAGELPEDAARVKRYTPETFKTEVLESKEADPDTTGQDDF